MAKQVFKCDDKYWNGCREDHETEEEADQCLEKRKRWQEESDRERAKEEEKRKILLQRKEHQIVQNWAEAVFELECGGCNELWEVKTSPCQMGGYDSPDEVQTCPKCGHEAYLPDEQLYDLEWD